MITRNFEITLRIPEQRPIPMMFQVVENDKDVYSLEVHITDGINEIDYSGVNSATITFSKGDGNVVQGNMTVGADALTYTMGTNEIAHPGSVLASIQLFGTNNERLTSARFRFDVVKDLITPSAVQSTSEFPLLQRIAEDVGDIVPLIPEIENTIQKMPEITQFFDTAAVSETQRIANESTRQTQETARQASIVDIENRFDDLTTQQQQDAEVIDARMGKVSLRAKIEDMDSKDAAHWAENASKHIHSSGSNANGRYIKFDDGTMICTKSVTITGDITDNTFTNTQAWASTFIDSNISITITTRNPVSANFRDYFRQIFITPNTTTVVLRIVPVTGQAMTLTNQPFDIVGIGRWK